MNLYRHAEWVRFRNEVTKLHGGRCARCDRSREDGAILQVHHAKGYVDGRNPWEYDHTECEALCKGCHAEEHGKIMPKSGWELIGCDDLGEVAENCELCGTDIRYVYAVIHRNWGSMAIGADCCDRLTSTTEASQHHQRHLKTVDKRKRFINSKRWKTLPNGTVCIRQKGIEVLIQRVEDRHVVQMDDAIGKATFDTPLDAKIKVFDLIESGEASAYLARRRQRQQTRLREAMKRHYGPRAVSEIKAKRALYRIRRLGRAE
jgi:hypothetical protein